MRPRSPLLGLAVIALFQAACTSWRVAELTPQELLAREPPRQIRVTPTSGPAVVLQEPRIAADTLVGVHRSMTPQGAIVYRTMAVPLAEVRQISVRRRDPAKTVGLVLDLLFVGAIYWAISRVPST